MAKRRGPKRGYGDGSISELPSGKFRASLPGARKAGSTATFETKREAQDWLRDQIGKPRDAKTLAEWVEVWKTLQAPEAAKKTIQRDGQVLDKYVLPHLGTLPLLALTTARINRWLADMHAAGKSPDERHRSWGTLRKILRAHDTFPREVLARVKTPKVKRGKKGAFTPEQVRDLFATADSWDETHPYLGAMVRVWLECCLRPREALGLRRDNYKDGAISVTQALDPTDEKPKATKNEHSVRTVELTSDTRERLERWLKAHPGHEPLFPGPRKTYWRYDSFLLVWRKLVKAAGLDGWSPGEMRHSGASLLVSEGLSILAIAERMGHADPTMILRVYGHCLPRDQAKLTAAFGRLYAAPEPGKIPVASSAGTEVGNLATNSPGQKGESP